MIKDNKDNTENNKYKSQAIIGTYFKTYQEADQNCAKNETVIDLGEGFLVVKDSILKLIQKGAD